MNFAETDRQVAVTDATICTSAQRNIAQFEFSYPSYEGMSAPEPIFGSWHHSRKLFEVFRYFSPAFHYLSFSFPFPSFFFSPPTAPSAPARGSCRDRLTASRRSALNGGGSTKSCAVIFFFALTRLTPRVVLTARA